jgi:2-polyprenyl-6-methoxyphenol hydroxylase-like FAD-dependent oxidoreductase
VISGAYNYETLLKANGKRRTRTDELHGLTVSKERAAQQGVDASDPAVARTTCCVVGGGPAGIMLGYLLARSGVDVTVLEKHGDFLRDFRGDTVHPSTLDALGTLGLLDEFLQRANNRQPRFAVQVGGETFPGPDFRFITARNKFVVFMAQWDFLNFLTEHAQRLPSFHLLMSTEGIDVVLKRRRVVGVKARTPDGDRTILADLVVGCDGRTSTMRAKAGMRVRDIGAPIDVLWFRIEKHAGDPPQTFGSIEPASFMVLIDRTDYWQCAFLIPKGTFGALQGRGIESFRLGLRAGAPFLDERLELLGWDDIKLLTVSVDRLRRWAKPGLLCIGDAAHAMSPVGGVGINLAIQDAIATANILTRGMRAGRVNVARLRAVQRRREFPTRVTQALQVLAHRRFLAPALLRTDRAALDGAKRALRRFGFLRFVIAQVVGVGVRPERPRIERRST